MHYYHTRTRVPLGGPGSIVPDVKCSERLFFFFFIGFLRGNGFVIEERRKEGEAFFNFVVVRWCFLWIFHSVPTELFVIWSF